MISFNEVKTSVDIATVAALADEIWTLHYVPIIGLQQVDYMLRNFQSEVAIGQQMNEGFTYFIVNKDNQSVGYFSIKFCDGFKIAQISKLYVRQSLQRSGVGRTMILFIETYCLNKGTDELWLTVNRDNAQAINFYQKMGFNKTRCLIQDIGNGFVMDDDVMKKLIVKKMVSISS